MSEPQALDAGQLQTLKDVRRQLGDPRPSDRAPTIRLTKIIDRLIATVDERDARIVELETTRGHLIAFFTPEEIEKAHKDLAKACFIEERVMGSSQTEPTGVAARAAADDPANPDAGA